MPKLDATEIHRIVQNEIDDAVLYQEEEHTGFRDMATNYFYGEKFGNEVEGQSQVVSRDVADTVGFIMPSLMKIFASSKDYVSFQPRHPEDEDALFAQFIGDPDLAMGRILNGEGDDRVLGFQINPVLQVGMAPGSVQQSLDAAIFHRAFVAVKGVSREAHDLAGLGDIAKLLRKVQQADFVFDDLFITLKHEGYLLFVFR